MAHSKLKHFARLMCIYLYKQIRRYAMKSKIKITPVKRKVTPKYPDQYSVELRPLLLRNKPLRWQATPVAGTVLSAVVMLGLAGCISEPVTMGSEPIIMGDIPMPDTQAAQTPFFEHGEGIGVYGCVSVAAPIFLSEDDAFAIISDEFEKLDITVKKGGGTVDCVQIPKVSLSPLTDEPAVKGTVTGSLEFDFAVEDDYIVMEFVSSDDVRAWAAGGAVSSVEQYNYKEAAKTLNESLDDEELNSVHGVFYDPAESIDFSESGEKDFEELEAEAREKSCETLREQVKDFIAWLGAQGVI